MKKTVLSLTLILSTTFMFAQTEKKPEETDLANMDLAELDRKLNNPLTRIWSLTFQNNTSLKDGDSIKGSEYSNNLFFQPFMPFEIGPDKEYMLTLRPVFSMVTQPEFNTPSPATTFRTQSVPGTVAVPGNVTGRTANQETAPGSSSGHKTGFGDIQMLTLAGPNKGSGIIWGAGFTTKFPTASHSSLGQEKWQVGPAAMLFYMGRPWVGGVLAQHWDSVAGDDDRDDTSYSEIQYTIRRSIPNAMSIGMGPTIAYDHEASSDNALTLPIGLGITKTMRWGKIPFKLRAEVHYSVIHPDDYGDEWNFRIQVSPIIPNPFI